MPRIARLGSVFASVVLCALFLPGCAGSKGVPVKGKLVLPPNVKLAEKDLVTVTLVPEAKDTPGATGKVSHTDQTFELTIGPKKGVSPGKYKVAVSLQPYPGEPGSDVRTKGLASINKKYSSEKTPLTCEVTSDPNQSITVDLAKSKVTKN